jgi:hypothetical protein
MTTQKPNDHTNTKWPQNIPHFSFQGPPKWTQIGIFIPSGDPGFERFVRAFVKHDSDHFRVPMLWFQNIFAEKFGEKNWRFWLKTKLNYSKIVIITLVSEKNTNFFRQKLSKIAENCDHNIDPVFQCFRIFIGIRLPLAFSRRTKDRTGSYLVQRRNSGRNS